MVVVISAIALVWESPVALGVMVVILVVLSLLVGVKLSYIRTVVSVMLPFSLLLLLTHGFFNTDRVMTLTGHEDLTPLLVLPEEWWLIGGGILSLEGFVYGWSVIFKSLAMVLVIPLAIFTTEVDNMIVGLMRARVPYKLVFVFSSTLRFFPLLFEEIQSIIEAQRLRGLVMEKMGPLKRVRVYGKVAVPLILGALVKSQQLEVVLQSKGFTGSSERTYLHESVLRTADWVTVALFVFLFIVAIVLYLLSGVGRFAWLIF
jgi:energy-coupling factor transport system permease protein